jgi:hypothetical protein
VSSANQPAAHWVHRSVSPKPVSKPSARLLQSAVPRQLLRRRVHPSLTTLLFRVPSRQILAPVLSVRSFACLGFFPLRDFTPAHPLFVSLPETHYVPLSGFLNLSAVFSARTFAGLFHPATTSRVHPVQGLLSFRSHPPSSGGACPLAVRTSSLTDRSRLPHPMSLDFEALLRVRTRSIRPVIHRTNTRSPPQVSLLQVFLFLALSTSLPGAFPLSTFPPNPFPCELGSGGDPQRIFCEKLGLLVSLPPTCSSFRAFHPKIRKNPVSRNPSKSLDDEAPCAF